MGDNQFVILEFMGSIEYNSAENRSEHSAHDDGEAHQTGTFLLALIQLKNNEFGSVIKFIGRNTKENKSYYNYWEMNENRLVQES